MHRKVLQVYKQKVKHLLYEHQQDLAALKIEAEQQQKQASVEAERRVQELVTDKQNLQRELNEQAWCSISNFLIIHGDNSLAIYACHARLLSACMLLLQGHSLLLCRK